MEQLIKQHQNPMKTKKPFIKKSHNSNSSSISKPNLSITKASHRLSLDKTFQSMNKRQESNIKPIKNHNEFTSSEILQQIQKLHTTRPSLPSMQAKQFFESNRRNSLKNQKKTSRKCKLEEILQSLDLNNSIIEELFQYEDEISHFKEQIKKTLNIYQELQKQLQDEIEDKRKNRRTTERPYLLDQKIKDRENESFCNKINQLRKKNQLFRQKENIGEINNDNFNNNLNKKST